MGSMAGFIFFFLVALRNIPLLSNILCPGLAVNGFVPVQMISLMSVSLVLTLIGRKHGMRWGVNRGTGFSSASALTQAPANSQFISFTVSPTVEQSIMAESTNLAKLHYVLLFPGYEKSVKSPLNKSAILCAPTNRFS